MSEDIYVVKVAGFLRYDDADYLKNKFEKELHGNVVVIDDTIKDVFKLEPQDGQALVRMLADEVLPEWRKALEEGE